MLHPKKQEDNPANLKLVENFLRKRKHMRLLSSHIPEIGIDLAKTQHPEIIFLDINMPGMNGYQVLKALKDDSDLNMIPVVAITANAMPQDIERGLAAGFDRYLTKPLNMNQFLETLDHFLDIR